MAEQQRLPHSLSLMERKKLSMTGVTEVISFDDTFVVLKTALGMLTVQGQDLKLKQLTLDGGNVAVDGEISGLSYEQPRTKGGWASRLFG